ncbi:hypothetical protein INR49_007284 [Caranx melampygus]|nr:hypothetical protein INR49_007284 [Caranx melampygus]
MRCSRFLLARCSHQIRRFINMDLRVFFDVSAGGNALGRIVMEMSIYHVPLLSHFPLMLASVLQLRPDVVPKTVGRKLPCSVHREKGFGYKGSLFHKVVPGSKCQGGDFINHNGTEANPSMERRC